MRRFLRRYFASPAPSRASRKVDSTSAARAAEVLDARTMLSGDVTATFAGGLLQLTGDAADNRLDVDIEVRTVDLGMMMTVDRFFVVFSSIDDTTVNGGLPGDAAIELGDVGSPIDFTGLIVDTGDGVDNFSLDFSADPGGGVVEAAFGVVGVNAQLGDGNDRFELSGFTTQDRVAVRGGAGNDVVIIDGTSDSVELYGEGDHDSLSITGTANEAEIVGGDGADAVGVSGTVGSLVVTDDLGADTVTLDGTITTASVTTGVGQDTVDASGDITTLTVWTGGGADDIALSGMINSAAVNSSTGDDVLTISGTIASLDVMTGGGLDTVDITETGSLTTSVINTGGENDVVNVHGDSTGLLHLITANGDDEVYVADTALIQAIKVWTGNGADTVRAFGIFEDVRMCTGAEADMVVFTGTATAGLRIFTDDGGDVVRLAQEPIPEMAFGVVIGYDKAAANLFGVVRVNTGSGADTLIASGEFDDGDDTTDNEFSEITGSAIDIVLNGGDSDMDELVVSDAMAADIVAVSVNFELPDTLFPVAP